MNEKLTDTEIIDKVYSLLEDASSIMAVENIYNRMRSTDEYLLQDPPPVLLNSEKAELLAYKRGKPTNAPERNAAITTTARNQRKRRQRCSSRRTNKRRRT